MGDQNKKVTIKNFKDAVEGEVMYLRLMVFSASKEVAIQRVMSFENSQVPLSLFKDDGTFVRSKKSAFLHKLNKLLPGPSPMGINSLDCLINYGNAFIQYLPPVHIDRITFRNMADKLLQVVMSNVNAL